MVRFLLPVALLFALVIGCIESNPQPHPAQDQTGNQHEEPLSDDATGQKSSPMVDDELIYASAAGAEGEVVIVGEAGAAPDANGGFAGAEEPTDSSEDDGDGDFAVKEDGSFVVVVPKIDPPKVTLVFTYPDSDDIVVELTVPGAADTDDDSSPWMYSGEGEPTNGPPAEFDGFEAGAGGVYGIAASDLGDGAIEVVGGFLSVTPLAKVVIANLTTGDTVIEQATNTGEFAATLSGMAGDEVSVFAVNPEEKEKATEAVVLVVE